MRAKTDNVDGLEDNNDQPKARISSINKLKDAAWSIIKGDFDSSRKIYEIAASDSETDEMQDLAETMGMLSVKIEARELSLKQKIDEIESKNVQLEQAAKLQSMSGFLLSGSIILLSFYVVFISQLSQTGWINDQVQTIITYSLLSVAGLGIFLYLRKFRFPLSYWGLTLKGSRRALSESILITIFMAALFIGLKIYLVNSPGSSFSGQNIFIASTSGVALFFYFINSFVQEFICRGFVQNNVERVLTGKYKSLFAVLTTAMLFGIVHMHYSGTTIFITIFAGLFFGLIYLRHRTLVGITVSHFILGELLFRLGLFG